MHQVHFNKETLPEVFKNYFKTNENSHKHETRQKSDYKIFRSNRKWRNCTVQNVGARMWNNLPPALKSISKQKNFSKNLKRTSYPLMKINHKKLMIKTYKPATPLLTKIYLIVESFALYYDVISSFFFV